MATPSRPVTEPPPRPVRWRGFPRCRLIVPTVSAGTPSAALCALGPPERSVLHSHAERGNDQSVATRLRGTPNILKNASKKDLASASSAVSSAHSRENFNARPLISFQARGMINYNNRRGEWIRYMSMLSDFRRFGRGCKPRPAILIMRQSAYKYPVIPAGKQESSRKDVKLGFANHV